MKINRAQINGFGNLINKDINFSNGINLIQGTNESGKSTLAYFIKAMFYGVNKNKAGNNFSEIERFKPWNKADFSGKLEYILDGKKFSIFRDFNRNNTKIFNDEGSEITATFNKDKSRGAEVGAAHFGIDEETFFSSLFISQGNALVEDNERKNIIQKLTNIIQSGEEGISFDKAKQKLHKYLIDEVGSDRTHNKPINVILREIDAFERTRDNLILNRSKRESINDRKKLISQKLAELNREYIDATKVYEVKERYSNMIAEREKEYDISVKLLEKERSEKIKKRNIRKDSIISLTWTACAASIVALIYYKFYVWIVLPVIFSLIIFYFVNKWATKEPKSKEIQDITVTRENFRRKEKKELELLKDEGIKESLLDRKLIDLKGLITGMEKKKNDLLLEEHKLNIENEGINEHIDKLNDVEEQLSVLYEKEDELRKIEFSVKLALEKLDEAYEELKNDVVPDIENAIKDNIKKTTNGTYSNVIYNDVQGLLIENDLGDVVPIEKLSMGTIDQMYLGFRFAMIDKIGNMPIILDEAFVYYDEERLENILKVLNMRAKNSQIILLTCGDREKRLLDKLKIKYNKIDL